MIGDIALIVTALGVLAAVYGLRQSYRERLQQFESMYVTRYWSLLDRLSVEALRGSDPKSLSNSDERVIRAYIRLCEDELEMREAGYIGDNTYILWAEGICEQFQQPMFERIWKHVRSELTFLYNHLDALLGQGRDYDPCKMRTWRRRIRGLAGFSDVRSLRSRQRTASPPELPRPAVAGRDSDEPSGSFPD